MEEREAVDLVIYGKNQKTENPQKMHFAKHKIFNFIKRYPWLCMLLAMALGVLIINMIPTAFAATGDQELVKKEFEEFAEGAKRTAYHQMHEAYKSFVNITKPSTTADIFSDSLVSFIKGIAHAMIIICMLMNLIKEAEKGDVGIDYWLKIFLTTAVAVMVVLTIDYIMGVLFNLGDIVITAVNDGLVHGSKTLSINRDALLEGVTTLPGGSNMKAIIDGDTNINWYQVQEAHGLMGILKYVLWFPMLISMFLIYSAIFEIKIRQLFAPIAVASIAYEGGRSAGVKFFKKFVGCFVKIAIYFGIAAVGYYMALHFYGEGITSPATEEKININLILMLGSPVIAALAMMQTGGLADEIVGV